MNFFNRLLLHVGIVLDTIERSNDLIFIAG